MIRHLDGQVLRVIASHAPNRHYHKHTGRVVRFVRDLASPHPEMSDMAEILWDRPFPVAENERQIITLAYLRTYPEGDPVFPPYIMTEIP